MSKPNNSEGLAETKRTNYSDVSQLRFTKAARIAQSALVAAEISPLNETIRGSLFAGSEIISNSSLVSSGAVGISTFCIETAGGLAAASLLDTDKAKEIFNKVNKKTRRLPGLVTNKDSAEVKKIPGIAKAGATLLGGTVVGMALEQRDNPQRTKKQNRRYSVVASGWLASTSGAATFLASEGIHTGVENPTTGAAIVGGVVGGAAGAGWLKHRFTKEKNEKLIPDLLDIDAETGIKFSPAQSPVTKKLAGELEQEVWSEKNYGNLDSYKDNIDNSRLFTAFDDSECVGIVRLFQPPAVAPFIDLPFYDPTSQAKILQSYQNGEIEELGTTAVKKGFRNGVVSNRLRRLAYRDARQRNIQYWGIIMEPERVEKMNKFFGFTFKQLGPTIQYQGGECAAHIMDL
ncbi:MAG: hypothetical protein ACR2KZ_13615, partial [Segetibacter sp.]